MTSRFFCSLVILAIFSAFQGHAADKKTAITTGASASKAAKDSEVKPLPPRVYPVLDSKSPPKLEAVSAILVDARSGKVLHEWNADQRRPVASTQKLMTALLVAEGGGLEEAVRVTSADTQTEPSMLYIKPGEEYSRLRLLKVLLVKSMNDVARCLARDHAGNIELFAGRMNEKARALGMTNSHFVNPNGLPAKGQYSTARDMSLLAQAAYRNKTIRSITSLKTLQWTYPDGHIKEFTNTNRVLANYALCNGMKTGYTEASGFCLVSSAATGGREVIAVVLGDKRDSIWTDSYRLLSWGLSRS
jgi:D-alanyl-D-alanine carboxypeptidase (penicillin-binding protein 5/6)